MEKRSLGTGGLQVSALGLGCMGMSAYYGPPQDRERMIALIRAAVDRGITFSLQSEYSLWARDPEAEVLQACEELGTGFVPWSPLGQGFLTGKVRADTTFGSSDVRSSFPRFSPEAMKANRPLVDLLTNIASRKHATPAQVALAWLLAQKPWIVPIPGTRNLHRLEENVGAVQVPMTADDLREIDGAAATIAVYGARSSGREAYR